MEKHAMRKINALKRIWIERERSNATRYKEKDRRYASFELMIPLGMSR